MRAPNAGRTARVPRARRDQGLRRRPVDRLGRRPLLPPAQPLDRDRLRASRATCPYVELLPLRDPRGQVTEVDINGVRAKLAPGWNRDPGQPEARRPRCGSRWSASDSRRTRTCAGTAACARSASPACSVRQSLRPPVLTARGAGRPRPEPGRAHLPVRAHHGRRPVPARPPDRQPAAGARQQPHRRRGRRSTAWCSLPAARSYDVSAWVHPGGRRRATRRSTGSPVCAGPRRFDSSGRFHDLPRYRASSAFDADPEHGLARHLGAARRRPTRGSRGRRPAAAASRGCASSRRAQPVRQPTLVRLSWPGEAHAAAGGGRRRRRSSLPAPACARARFRLTVLDAAFPPDAPTRASAPRGRWASARSSVPGAGAGRVPTTGPLHAGLRERARRRGRPAVAAAAERHRRGARRRPAAAGARLRRPGRDGGGRPVRPLAAGPTFSVDLLRLRSPAPVGAARRHGRRHGRRPRQDRQQLRQGRAGER